MNKKHQAYMGLISSLVLCLFGVSQWAGETSSADFIPILFAVGGFFGIIGAVIELKKEKSK
ncbi:hypothetical protein [Halobacillus sp. Marseille-Q1614]|uniref:hypothetical protein n=1 Tax=Halobacillus sp. Marseille-Q1614 TaxID=2709134 RepID=UPI00156DA65E|nr:hypothetical protein [Halobacillus sp. Marseille-Q1614]